MSDVLEGIIKEEDLDTPPERVSFEALLDADARFGSHRFVRFLPNGQLPKPKEVPKEPVISQEELQQRRLDKIEQETFKRAFADGEKAGLALAEETMAREIGRVLPQFEAVLRKLDGLPKRVFASTERFLVETSISLVRELLAHELTVNPQGIASRIQRILDQAAGRKDIVIYVSPGNAELLQRLGTFDNLRIEADPGIAPGSVRMDSDFGGMDDNLERQLASMESGLRGYLLERLESMGCEDMLEAVEIRASGKPVIAKCARPGLELKPPAGVAPEQGHAPEEEALPRPTPTPTEEEQPPIPDPEESRVTEHVEALAAGMAAASDPPVVEAEPPVEPDAESLVTGEVPAAEPLVAEETPATEPLAATPAEEEGTTDDDLFSVEALTAGFASADWSQDEIVQPAWLADESSDDDDDDDIL